MGKQFNNFNVQTALVVLALGALTLPAAAQGPPRSLDMQGIWSSQVGELRTLDVSASRAFDDLMLVPLKDSVTWTSDVGPSQDMLICEPHGTISIK